MALKIILQKLIEKERESLKISPDWQYRELKKFGLDWELFLYQQKAIENITDFLYLLYHKREGLKEKEYIEKNKKDIIDLYRKN